MTVHVDRQMMRDERRAVRLAKRDDPIEAAGLTWHGYPLSYYQGHIGKSLVRFQWAEGVAIVRKMVRGNWKPVDVHITWGMADDDQRKRLEAIG